MEDLPLGRVAALVPEFAVKDLPLGRTLIMMMFRVKNNIVKFYNVTIIIFDDFYYYERRKGKNII